MIEEGQDECHTVRVAAQTYATVLAVTTGD